MTPLLYFNSPEQSLLLQRFVLTTSLRRVALQVPLTLGTSQRKEASPLIKELALPVLQEKTARQQVSFSRVALSQSWLQGC